MLKYVLILQSNGKTRYAVDSLYASDIGDMVRCEGHSGLFEVIDRFVDIGDVDLEKALSYGNSIWKVTGSYQKRWNLEADHV